MVGACGAKVQMIKYTGGSPQQSRDGGLTGSLGTKKKILGVISIVVVLSLMMVGVRWLFFNVIKSSQMLDGLVEFRAGKSAVDKNMSGFMRMKKMSDIWA